MSSAQLEIHPGDELAHHPATPLPPFELTQPDLSPTALKQQVADRVAAHRARRGQTSTKTAPLSSGAQPSFTQTSSRPSRVRSANIAAAVAERYAHSQTYRTFLAAEAERAVHQAHATAKIATINAEAIAVAQQQLLADLDHWHASSETSGAPAAAAAGSPHIPLSAVDYATFFDQEPATSGFGTDTLVATATSPPSAISFTIRPYADVIHPATAPRSPTPEPRIHIDQLGREIDEDERLSLEDEIAFRHNPVFEEASPQEPIAANLIEFPRQLIAARKTRPRIAEGPLRDDDANTSSAPQLRIFEVEAGQVSAAPAAESLAPEWASILLSALPSANFAGPAAPDYLAINIPQAAPISRRLTSAAVDMSLILTVQAAFTTVFAFALTHLSGQNALHEIPRNTAVAGSACTLVVLALLYQVLFFTLSNATPGMRYARIGLCTFTNENPTHSAMRHRVLAVLLAAFPLGLGLLWALLDEDTLGWHDRISHMYQRSY